MNNIEWNFFNNAEFNNSKQNFLLFIQQSVQSLPAQVFSLELSQDCVGVYSECLIDTSHSGLIALFHLIRGGTTFVFPGECVCVQKPVFKLSPWVSPPSIRMFHSHLRPISLTVRESGLREETGAPGWHLKNMQTPEWVQVEYNIHNHYHMKLRIDLLPFRMRLFYFSSSKSQLPCFHIGPVQTNQTVGSRCFTFPVPYTGTIVSPTR